MEGYPGNHLQVLQAGLKLDKRLGAKRSIGNNESSYRKTGGEL